MDEDESPSGAGVNSAAQSSSGSSSPEQIRAEIEQTRAELGDTVAKLAEKTDVKVQAKRAAHAARETATGKVADVKETVAAKAGEVSGAAQQATPASAADAGRHATAFIREQRAALIALGAFGIGLMVGRRR